MLSPVSKESQQHNGCNGATSMDLCPRPVTSASDTRTGRQGCREPAGALTHSSTWRGRKHWLRAGGGDTLFRAPARAYSRTPPPPPAGPGLLFILPGTQRLQEQHVIDNKPSAGQGLAIGSACKSRGWRVGAALQNKSLGSLRHPQAPKSQSPGVLPPVGRQGLPGATRSLGERRFGSSRPAVGVPPALAYRERVPALSRPRPGARRRPASGTGGWSLTARHSRSAEPSRGPGRCPATRAPGRRGAPRRSRPSRPGHPAQVGETLRRPNGYPAAPGLGGGGRRRGATGLPGPARGRRRRRACPPAPRRAASGKRGARGQCSFPAGRGLPFPAWVHSVFPAPLPGHRQSWNSRPDLDWPGLRCAALRSLGCPECCGSGLLSPRRGSRWVVGSSPCTLSGPGMQRLPPPGARPRLVLRTKCVCSSFST
uniref:collagen alpha-4(IV) chain-like n=1 Tax=Nyctereutes procyonoides TaxID=34880 RepID=UPI002444B61C|nr:collagen alpha-4(IV) chain-like [Nyctereutes procyonoides]